ncbi:deoxyribodipyrimidine photo-lyase [Pseudomonas sp. HR96]|uniref:deoxyribodipyrimidine photo-lyase n=1 Tax=Pseudomonas sp. HR96 TaxID=1027966 RepID=UPI002A75AAB0|nr:deoxyribodipyrimidine photo-lyase [Pseudomonas sp. HR96]WPP00673.1 deoxyribodipyrimidine photo-lyase [Pseudomonas sp. HR96]
MQLIWFRCDLRVHDNTALAAACKQGPVVALYLVSPGQWREHDDAPAKVDFWLRNLAELRQQLEALHIPLLVRTLEFWSEAPKVLAEVCGQHSVQAVHCNEEYGVNESARDSAVRQRLGKDGIELHSHLDQLFFKPGSVLTKSGTYFQVFSQFRKVCYERFHQSVPALVPKPRAQAPVSIKSDALARSADGFAQPPKAIIELWPAGEDEARRRLTHFCGGPIEDYLSERDLPAHPGTSQLSAYLAAGVVSPRQCLHAALASNQGEFQSGNVGAVTWINELCWREFYKHILVGYPRVSMHRAFRQETEALRWRDAPADLQAWQEGRTGLPIVDAAMRQLVATGWMHNRLRMITAMFLTKNLLIDWRLGERFFMQHLIDGDLASNNGGWQWSSSTGTDASPYFRIFNPTSQSAKFDAQGVFIRQWVPELASLGNKEVHDPNSVGDLFSGVGDYPRPIVDLRKSRERALAAFRDLPQREVGG